MSTCRNEGSHSGVSMPVLVLVARGGFDEGGTDCVVWHCKCDVLDGPHVSSAGLQAAPADTPDVQRHGVSVS